MHNIILSEPELHKFLNILPELQDGECFYLTLLARKKYNNTVKNNKVQLRRFTVTSKEDILPKLRQLECRLGAYGVPQDSLAAYIMPNPRSFKEAAEDCLREFSNIVIRGLWNKNPHQEAMSCIQRCQSKGVFIDFDFDLNDSSDFKVDALLNSAWQIVPKGQTHVVHTRGGFHLLVRTLDTMGSTWYNSICSLTDDLDVRGDTLLPIPGCIQGGFMPYLQKL